MKNTYIFLLLVCLTLNSFGKNPAILEISSVNFNDTNIDAIESSMTNYVRTLTMKESITYEDKCIVEFNSDRTPYKTKISRSQFLFFNPSGKNQPINKNTNSDSRLKIRLEFHTSANFNREILLTIDDRSTDAFDKGFDAFLNDEFPNDMYWMIDDGKLIIQAINELPKEKVVPIGIKSLGDCTLQIKVASIENPYPDMEVYLRDNSTMETYDIKNGTFEVTLEEGQFNDKYAVVFQPKAEISIQKELELDEVEYEFVLNEAENNEVQNEVFIFVGEYNELLRIRKSEEMIVNNISLFNMLGQQIKVWNSNLNENEIDLAIQVNRGVHLVLMNTSKGRVMKKVIIK